MPLQANSNGVVVGFFMIPPNVPTGVKSVKMRGSGGTKGEAVYVASGQILTDVLRTVYNTVVDIGVDPLAQTFVLPENRIIGAVDVKFCGIGSPKNPIYAQIRNTEAGVPGSTILAEGRIMPSAVHLPLQNGSNAPLASNLAPSSWTWIYSLHPTQNYFADQFIQVLGNHGSGDAARGLLKFNLPLDLAGGTVVSATLRLTKAHNIGDANYALRVRRMTQDWGNTATWNNSANVTPWTTPGGLFAVDNAHDGSTVFAGGDNITQDVDVTALVQAWATGAPNFGVLLQDGDESNAPDGWLQFDKTVFPRLIITYRPAASSNATGDWTRINFDVPIPLIANNYYAVVLLTDDAVHSVAVAELGQYVRAGDGPREGWVTQQPYQIGELLTSSNAKTWTPNPKIDLCFRLMACKFTANNAVVDFGDISVAGVSDLIPQAAVIRPSGEVDCEFDFTERGNTGNVHTIDENGGIQLLDFLTDTLNVRARLTGTDKMSPIILAGVQVLSGTLGLTGKYVTQSIPCDDDFDVTVTYETFKPAGSSIAPKMSYQRMVSGAPAIDSNGVYLFDWSAMTKTTTNRIADGWLEETWSVQHLRGVGLDWLTQCWLDYVGSPNARIQIRNLRIIIK